MTDRTPTPEQQDIFRVSIEGVRIVDGYDADIVKHLSVCQLGELARSAATFQNAVRVEVNKRLVDQAREKMNRKIEAMHARLAEKTEADFQAAVRWVRETLNRWSMS